VPNLSVQLVPRLLTIAPNDADEIVVYVKNSGSAGSLQTHLAISLPAGITPLGAPSFERGSGCSGTTTIDCFLDYIPNGETTRVILEVRGTASGLQVVTASATADRDSDLADNNASVTIQVGTPAAPPPVFPTPMPTAPKGKTMNGSGGADRLTGTAFADVLNGRGGNDTLNGGKGNDRLDGGAGNDTVIGGPGLDRLFGGVANDIVRAQDKQRDVIDCGAGRDQVYADRGDKVAKNCEVVRRR
jgi:Ca2+-binding RTX toxin-like protein